MFLSNTAVHKWRRDTPIKLIGWLYYSMADFKNQYFSKFFKISI
nr:MAG TPA: hypothetical protein [Caudoviricetes sp.]